MMERRRQRAWVLHCRGWRSCDIAMALGVSRPAVSQWLSAARKDGAEALAARFPTGAPVRLSSRHQLMLTAMLRDSPEVFGIDSSRWLIKDVALMIERLFGVAYTPQHVGRLIRAANASSLIVPPVVMLELRDLIGDRTVAELRNRINYAPDTMSPHR